MSRSIKQSPNIHRSTDSHSRSIAEVVASLQTNVESGLTDQEARRRLKDHGPNKLRESVQRPPVLILWEQFYNTLIVLLLAAAAVSAYLSAYTDAIVILAIVFLNATLGFFQEYRAERALASLMQVSVPQVQVRRDGRICDISTRDVVPGDIILLAAGNIVPADARIVMAEQLGVNEAALTGESVPVDKSSSERITRDAPVSDRRNMVFMGTEIIRGRAIGAVTGTGMDAELGVIAGMLERVRRDPTPLQRKLAQLARRLALVALVLVSLVFVIGVLRGEPLRLMFLTALSLAVAAVPEGLPAVATVALALGARRMLRQHALIRRLTAVETLGSVTVICSDKTGTLTKNAMSVSAIYLPGDGISSFEGREDDHSTDTPLDDGARWLWYSGVLCNDTISTVDEHGTPTLRGDPTEVAIVTAGQEVGYTKSDIEPSFIRVGELPFETERKRMITVHRVVSSDREQTRGRQMLPHRFDSQPFVAFGKGAVSSLLQVCTEVWNGREAVALDETWQTEITDTQETLARQGLRVLGFMVRPLAQYSPTTSVQDVEAEFAFVGMVGMVDPARPEARDAISRCTSAGIRPIMITGDHPATARRIAENIGIEHIGQVLTGSAITELDENTLGTLVDDVSIFARVSPAHKLQIVRALQEKGHIVAMTGDGVNDAPALKKADIGVAMGVNGTDVAKEASDMVLLDDNFATIVNAVEAGRSVYDNIRKFVRYTLTSNAGELWVMLMAPLLGMPLPLLPAQILWINLVTDGLPGLALAVEPTERHTMQRPPRPPSQTIFSDRVGRDIIIVGLLMGAISVAAGFFFWRNAETDDTYWRTIIFTVLTLSQLGQALAVRSSTDSIFSVGFFSNKFMLVAVALTFGLQLAVIYVPTLQNGLSTTALTLGDFIICCGLSTVVFWVVEGLKLASRRRRTPAAA